MNTRLVIGGAMVLVTTSVVYGFSALREEMKLIPPDMVVTGVGTLKTPEPQGANGATLADPPLTIPPEQPPLVQGGTNVLSITDVTRDKERFLGKTVRVQGKVVVNIFLGEMVCSPDEPACDTTLGARLELWEPRTVPGIENLILLFSHNEPYPCPKTAPAQYVCAHFTDGEITTVEGVWSKDSVAVAWRGGSGGGAPTPTRWEDRYFLNIK